jgi:fluoride exporter
VNIVLVAAGGGVGAVSRYLIGTYVNSKFQNNKIPIAMLIVNIIGAGGLGLFLSYSYEAIASSLYACRFYHLFHL